MMIRYRLFLVSLFLLSACSGGGGNGGTTDGSATTGETVTDDQTEAVTPVHVTFYAHNEDTWQNHVANEASYLEYRNNLLEKLHLLSDYGVALNWQSDIVVLEGMVGYEQGDMLDNTGGKTIVRYMVEDLGFSVDPHGHLRMCNYADLAYLIEQLGGPTPEVIGGFRLFDFGDDYLGFLTIRDWRQDIELGEDGIIHGRKYPEASWSPKIISVPAISGHWFDEFSSGIWRPGQGIDFFTDDPDGSHIYVAQGYPHSRENLGETQASGAIVYQEDAKYIQELVEKIESGELPKDRMYTASIHIRDQPVVHDSGEEVDTLEGLQNILEDLKPLYDAGKIKYVTYQEAVSIWRSDYAAEPNRVEFADFSMTDAVRSQAEAKSEGTLSGPDFIPLEILTYDEDTLEADTRIACDACGENGVFARIHFPSATAKARYADTGSPVVVMVQGGVDNIPTLGGEPSDLYLATGLGMTTVYFNYPGNGEAPYDSGGEYDQRGPVCQEALNTVLRFCLGWEADRAGRLITDIVPYADLNNVGLLGSSNGGNLAIVTLDRHADELTGIAYYVGYENPAGDEYVLTDLGARGRRNLAYQRGATVLDPVKGSVSTLNPTRLRFDEETSAVFFDVDLNSIFAAGTDYGCSYWLSGGIRYYSTEIASLLNTVGLVTFPHPLIANPVTTAAFWDDRDMSRHTASAVSKIGSLKGAILIATQEDHVQDAPGYPHIVVNYQGWSAAPFVRLNPDAAYTEHLFAEKGMNTAGMMLSDNPAGTGVDFINVDTMTEPDGPDMLYNLAGILEMADRVHFDRWEPNLAEPIDE